MIYFVMRADLDNYILSKALDKGAKVYDRTEVKGINIQVDKVRVETVSKTFAYVRVTEKVRRYPGAIHLAAANERIPAVGVYLPGEERVGAIVGLRLDHLEKTARVLAGDAVAVIRVADQCSLCVQRREIRRKNIGRISLTRIQHSQAGRFIRYILDDGGLDNG